MTPFEPHLSLLLERSGRLVTDRLSKAIGREGISAEHWRVLKLLSDETSHSMGDMAERLDINPPTLTKLIDRMVGQSLVQRAADPVDYRRVVVFVTDAGLDLLDELQVRINEHYANLDEQLGKQNTQHLKELLTSLIKVSTP